MGSPVVWFEIRTPDVERAKEFYGMLFGWRFARFEAVEDDYWVISTEEGTVSGGLAAGQVADGDQAVTLFIQVSDIDGTADAATVLGASIEQPRREISEGAGAYAILRDPDGVRFGIWASSLIEPGPR